MPIQFLTLEDFDYQIVPCRAYKEILLNRSHPLKTFISIYPPQIHYIEGVDEFSQPSVVQKQ